MRHWKRAALAAGALLLLSTVTLLGVRIGVITTPELQARASRLFARTFGAVAIDPGVYRGGQPTAFGREWISDVYRFGTVIHLAWRDTPADLEEQRYFESIGVDYHHYAWNPEGPPSKAEIEQVLALVESARKPVYVHCIGGKDRTGGLIGMLELRRGAGLVEITSQWRRYGNPSPGWQEALRTFSRTSSTVGALR